MKNYDTSHIDTLALEREARRMQARAVADGARRIGRWVRGAFGN